ncbi:MAG: glycosyltransferase family 9 protein [Candidatus Schekmanbacteria bacterium]|nr:glycosyltransferase family 9 protein [Candidatus Schekmanbacteria bacterium]
MKKNKYQYMRGSYKLIAIVTDFVGGAILSFFRFFIKKRSLPVNPQRIAVFRMDKLGDVVLSIPAIRGIKKLFPAAEMTLLISGMAEDIFRYERNSYKIITYDGILNCYMTGSKREIPILHDIKNALLLLRELREKKFDLAVILRGDIFTNMLVFMSRIPSRIGFGNEGGYFFLTDIIPLSQSRYHELERMEDVLRFLGEKEPECKMGISLSDAENEAVGRLLRENNLDNSLSYSVISPFTGHKWNTWDADRFLKLARRLRDEAGLTVIMTGSEGEKKGIENLIGGEMAMHNFAGKTSLLEFVALLKRAKLFVGNDSGPVHLAVSSDVPAVQLFGPGDMRRFAHRGGRNAVLFKETCSLHPCTIKECKVPEKWCMNEITVDGVFDACMAVLNKHLK